MPKKDLPQNLEAYWAGAVDSDGLARSFYSDTRLRRITAAVGARYQLSKMDVEDAFQRAIVVFFDKFLDTGKITDVGGAYSLWYAITQKVAQETKANYRETSLSCEDDSDISDPLARNQDLSVEIDDTEIDSLIASAAFEKALIGSKQEFIVAKTLDFNPMFAKSKTPPMVIKTQPRETRRVVRKLTPAHSELVAIREALGMTIQEFAAALEIKPERLSSYLYGKTDAVPAFVMNIARELKAGNGNRSMQFANRPMAEIAASWMEKLGCGQDALAGLLGVSLTTLDRWLKNGPRPELSRLMEYDASVERMAEFNKSRAAA